MFICVAERVEGGLGAAQLSDTCSSSYSKCKSKPSAPLWPLPQSEVTEQRLCRSRSDLNKVSREKRSKETLGYISIVKTFMSRWCCIIFHFYFLFSQRLLSLTLFIQIKCAFGHFLIILFKFTIKSSICWFQMWKTDHPGENYTAFQRSKFNSQSSNESEQSTEKRGNWLTAGATFCVSKHHWSVVVRPNPQPTPGCILEPSLTSDLTAGASWRIAAWGGS